MTFLFPITIPGEKYYRDSKYTTKIIYINRKVENIINHSVDLNMVRNVNRVCPNIEPMSEEYFLILRETLPVFEFFCHTVDMIVNLDYCFSSCRFQHKRYCDTYLRGTICCRICDDRYSCKNIDDCKKRRLTLLYMSLYFSELMKKPNIVIKMRRGLGYKRNYKGDGAQIYFNVGTMPISIFNRHNQVTSVKHARKMLNKRRLEAKRYVKKTRRASRNSS